MLSGSNSKLVKGMYSKQVFTALFLASFLPFSAMAQSSAPPSLSNIPQNQGGASGDQMRIDPSRLEVPSVAGAQAQSAAQAERARQEARKRVEAKAREKAVDQALEQFLPMEPAEIRKVLQRLRTTQEAAQTPIRRPPTPEIQVETIQLDPAAKPPVIKLATDTVTTVTFLDVTGEPWPIVDIGFGGSFDIKMPEPGGNFLRITPLKEFATGNISLRLLDFTTPLTMMMQAGGEEVHYRFDAQIPEYGPNALLPIITAGGGGIDLMAGDRVLSDFIEGVIPDNAEKLDVSGVDGRTSAYKFGEGVFVRTPHTLLSPSWKSSARSAEGLNVYYVDSTPILLLSRGGNPVKVTLKRQESRTF